MRVTRVNALVFAAMVAAAAAANAPRPVDASTHMPLMMTWQGPAFGAGRGGRGGRDGQPAPPAALTLAMHLADYKAVNGLKLPFTITRSVNDQTIEDVSLKSYKINPSFKATTFTKPQ